MPNGHHHLKEPLATVIRPVSISLRDDLTVKEALQAVRDDGTSWGDKVIYFYVVDAEERLVGVVPTRRLLTSPHDSRLRDIMVKRVLSLPASATILEGCEAFLMHRLLAFPVVDKEKKLVGLVDVGLLADEALDLAEPQAADSLFESIGLHLAQVKDASVWQAFRYRFPWLLATIASGTVCAVLAGFFELTLAESLILAFFLTLVLGLGESVSMQSMTVTIQVLRTMRPTVRWYFRSLFKETGAAALLGLGCGVLVALIAYLWRGLPVESAVIGASIFLSLNMACFLGLTVPTVLHALRLDPKVAAGPLTLALTDVFTVLFYLGLATLILM